MGRNAKLVCLGVTEKELKENKQNVFHLLTKRWEPLHRYTCNTGATVLNKYAISYDTIIDWLDGKLSIKAEEELTTSLTLGVELNRLIEKYIEVTPQVDIAKLYLHNVVDQLYFTMEAELPESPLTRKLITELLTTGGYGYDVVERVRNSLSDDDKE